MPPSRKNALALFDWPPVWLVAGAAAMWALAEFVPAVAWDRPWSRWLGLALIAAAFALAGWSVVAFARRRTPVIPRQAPTTLITDGPFRFSRNPIYLSDVLILVGWGFWLAALTPFLIVPLFAVILERRFIVDEEARLEAAFGARFDAYAARTRRWL